MPNPQSPTGDETPPTRTRRFTPLRRRVLGLLAARGGSATAYQLLEDLNRQSPHAAPPTIYRALQFLIREGLVRHVSTTSTFRLTGENEGQHEIFAVCTHCHSVRALHSTALQQALLDTALSAHFEVQGQQTEIKGICEDCTRRPTTNPPARKK